MIIEFRKMSEKRKHEEECNQGVIRPAKTVRTITTTGHITTWPEDMNERENKESEKELTENLNYENVG